MKTITVGLLGVVCIVLLGQSTRAGDFQPVDAYPRPGAVKILENDRVIIWRVTFKKGVPTPLHVHKLDKVTVFLQDVTIADTSADGKRDVWSAKAEDVYFSKAGTVHIEEGLNTTPRDVIAIEIK